MNGYNLGPFSIHEQPKFKIIIASTQPKLVGFRVRIWITVGFRFVHINRKCHNLLNDLFQHGFTSWLTDLTCSILDCKGTESGMTLESILVFATGASEIPPLGFQPGPTIQFWNDVRPRSNTCGNVLFLPLHNVVTDEISYETFKYYMDDAIQNSPTFGVA